MIQLAKLSQIEEILNITKACASKMVDEGISQWNDSYPNSKVLIHDVIREELYVLSNENNIVGCIVISTKMDEEYKAVKWLTKTSRHYYIHRLAVHPDHQRKGYARLLMDFAEDLGVQNNKASIRLDTFSKNIGNQKLYEGRGFKKLGNIYFPKQSEFPFFCYELKLPIVVS